MIRYVQCPICGSKTIQEQFQVKDYTVSRQYFAIWKCGECSLQFTQNIPDQSSIGAFYQSDNYISHTDSRKGLVNRLYHLARKMTIRKKRRLILSKTKTKAGALLDIGAGTGAFLKAMQETAWQITGIEPDELARKKANERNGLTLQTPETLFQLSPGTFDAITMWHVLEHVHDLHNYIDQIKSVLKKNGLLFVAVPNYTSKDAQIYRQYWAAYDVPRHLYHFNPQSIRKLLQQHGMTLKEIKPMWLDSFYISLLSEKYKNEGKGNFIKAIWNGLRSNFTAWGNKEKCSSLIYIIQKETT